MIAEQKAAYVNVRIARAIIKMNGMVAENNQHPGGQPYGEKQFFALIDEERINENDITEELFRE